MLYMLHFIIKFWILDQMSLLSLPPHKLVCTL